MEADTHMTVVSYYFFLFPHSVDKLKEKTFPLVAGSLDLVSPTYVL
jgi:hypothetical protein